MNHIMRGLIAATKKWWVVLLIIIANFASFGILFGLEDQFEAITEVPVYDTQNDLTSELIREQFPLYRGEARDAYLRFAAFDFVFPLVAGLFLTVLWTLLLRFNQWHVAQRLLGWGLPLFPLIGTVWDWLENVSLLAMLNSGAVPDATLIQTALLFKKLKLTWLAANGAITGVLLVLLMIHIGYRLWNRQRKPNMLTLSE